MGRSMSGLFLLLVKMAVFQNSNFYFVKYKFGNFLLII